MIDDDVALFGGDPNKACRAYSDPLFLTDYFMHAGHTSSVSNGTATFIRRRGQVYACTCRHILEAVHQPGVVDGAHPTAALLFGQVRQNLSFWSAEGLQLSLRSPDGGIPDHRADVAIVRLGHAWELLTTYKPKVAIDLDSWEPPPWRRFNYAMLRAIRTNISQMTGRLCGHQCPCSVSIWLRPSLIAHVSSRSAALCQSPMAYS